MSECIFGMKATDWSDVTSVTSSSQNKNRNVIKIETNITITTKSIAICFWPWKKCRRFSVFSCHMKIENESKKKRENRRKKKHAVHTSRKQSIFPATLGVCIGWINRCLYCLFLTLCCYISIWLCLSSFLSRCLKFRRCGSNVRNGNFSRMKRKFNVILWWKTHYNFYTKYGKCSLVVLTFRNSCSAQFEWQRDIERQFERNKRKRKKSRRRIEHKKKK